MISNSSVVLFIFCILFFLNLRNTFLYWNELRTVWNKVINFQIFLLNKSTTFLDLWAGQLSITMMQLNSSTKITSDRKSTSFCKYSKYHSEFIVPSTNRLYESLFDQIPVIFDREFEYLVLFSQRSSPF